MRYCTKCLFPETKPDLFFDGEGVCDACRSAERKRGEVDAIDWKDREDQFKKILGRYRSKDGSKYDCIVPVSGGKDSFFQTYSMRYTHKMNPLAVTFDQFDQTDIGRHNLEILREIGVDHIHFTMNPKIVRKLVRKGFEIVGDPYWINHVGILTVPSQISVAFEVPLIIWGENPQIEYGGPALSKENKTLDLAWREEFGGMRGYREEDMVDEEISLSDLKSLIWPPDGALRNAGTTGLFYGYFFNWDTRRHMEIAKQYGWKNLPEPWPGSWLNYENCDMAFLDIREHLKWLKYGYGRATDQVNIYIRKKLLTREEGLSIILEKDGRVSQNHIDKFCEFIGIPITEYERIRDSFVNTDIFIKKASSPEGWMLKNNPV